MKKPTLITVNYKGELYRLYPVIYLPPGNYLMMPVGWVEADGMPTKEGLKAIMDSSTKSIALDSDGKLWFGGVQVGTAEELVEVVDEGAPWAVFTNRGKANKDRGDYE